MKEQITFKDWLKHRLPGVTRTQAPGSQEAKVMELLQEAWDASAVIEREECVKVADGYGHSVEGSREAQGAALVIADAIRDRSKKKRRG